METIEATRSIEKIVKQGKIIHFLCHQSLSKYVLSMYNLKIKVMKKILFTMFFIGMIFPMTAQIKGTVTDSGNNPVRNAKVAIYSLPDSVQIAGTTANERGEFEFPAYRSVNKLIKVSYNGYRSTTFRALPEQHIRLRDELNMPEELAQNRPLSFVPDREI